VRSPVARGSISLDYKAPVGHVYELHIGPGDDACADGWIEESASKGLGDCKERCDDADTCRFVSLWSTGGINWCRLTKACGSKKQEKHHQISIYAVKEAGSDNGMLEDASSAVATDKDEDSRDEDADATDQDANRDGLEDQVLVVDEGAKANDDTPDTTQLEDGAAAAASFEDQISTSADHLLDADANLEMVSSASKTITTQARGCGGRPCTPAPEMLEDQVLVVDEVARANAWRSEYWWLQWRKDTNRDGLEDQVLVADEGAKAIDDTPDVAKIEDRLAEIRSTQARGCGGRPCTPAPHAVLRLGK